MSRKGQPLTTWVTDDMAEMLESFRTTQRVRPDASAVLRTALREFLAYENDPVAQLVERLATLREEDMKRVLAFFCRSCGVRITGPDWSDRNFCYRCSPDPRE